MRLRTQVRLAPFIILVTALPAAAQTTADPRIDSLFARAVFPDSTGCAVGVVRDGRLVYARGYGTADLEHGVPVTAETPFHLGSISKQFTAMAVLMLEQEGRLSLDDDVRRYVPEVPDFGTPITIRHLLHHTSGLRDLWDLLGFSGRRTDDVVREYDILRLLSRQRALNFRPGDEHLYNNTGYILLGVIVKRVSGKPLPELARERIFAPLGMTSTRFLDDHTTLVPGRATGYARRRDGLRIAMPAYDVVGSGGAVSTVADLARWARNFDEMAVGGPAVIARMREPGRLNGGSPIAYGGGIRLLRHRGVPMEEHNGVDPGYFANLVRFPDQRLAVATLCNGHTIDAIAVTRAIAEGYLPAEAAGTPASAPAAEPEVVLAPAQVARFAGTYHNPSNDLVRMVVVRGGELFYVFGPGNEARLAPLSPTRFLLTGRPTRVEFVTRPGSARPEMVVTVAGSPPGRYVPVEPAEGLPARLSEYPGVYDSPEIGSTFLIGELEGDLHWRLEGVGPDEFSITLPARFRDNFGEGGVSLQFVRDGAGRVTALLLTTERARRLRFDRRAQ
ncbi:MAG TPA: serine hydrolase domain-containing protein [Longimicrobium sp.]|nr:serine hydrolase domain-containing protein [Longimicrobium sp.]